METPQSKKSSVISNEGEFKKLLVNSPQKPHQGTSGLSDVCDEDLDVL
jgi:hypothetical protein